MSSSLTLLTFISRTGFLVLFHVTLMDEREKTVLYRCRHGHLKTKITSAVSGSFGM
jgi:hypothetical protein